MTFAALTSAISLLEPAVEFVECRGDIIRSQARIGAGILVWLLGVAPALAVHAWSGIACSERASSISVDFLTANIMLPVTALPIAVFSGWVMAAPSTARCAGNRR